MKEDEVWKALGDAFANAYAKIVLNAVRVTPADVQKAKDYNPNLWNDIAWDVYLKGQDGVTRADVEEQMRRDVEAMRSRRK